MNTFEEVSIYEESPNLPVIPKVSSGEPKMPKVLIDSVGGDVPGSRIGGWFKRHFNR
jgi:hypothetical protein